MPLVCVSGKTGEGLDDLKSQVTNRDYGYDSDGQKKNDNDGDFFIERRRRKMMVTMRVIHGVLK